MGKARAWTAFILAALLAVGAAAEGRTLIPGGQLIGVAIQSDGLIYVGASDLGSAPSPARLAGLRSGDVIVTLDGARTPDTAAFTERIAEGRRVTLGVERAGKTLKIDVEPGRDPRDGQYRIGAWVRQNAAGVGTVTYIDPKTGVYGALGHAIEDPDAQVLIPVRSGGVFESAVTAVVKGEKGDPGQLEGDFQTRNRPIGTVEWNEETGIGGVFVSADAGNPLFPDGIQTSDDVSPGAAQIISTIDADGPRLFDIRILRVDRESNTRNLLIEITDEALIRATGGIVQGMSGSPILQNGYLVGAVTHVLVDNPARGYGIRIGNMLESAETNRRAA